MTPPSSSRSPLQRCGGVTKVSGIVDFVPSASKEAYILSRVLESYPCFDEGKLLSPPPKAAAEVKRRHEDKRKYTTEPTHLCFDKRSTTSAAAESGDGRQLQARGQAHIHNSDNLIRGRMEMYFKVIDLHSDQDLKGEAKRAFKILLLLLLFK